MLENLIIEATDSTPEIILDIKNNKFEIKGRSLPEDACEFFNPIKDWLKEYCKTPNEQTILHCKLDYFNSATSRKLVELFSIMECLAAKNSKIVWHYKKDDSVILDKGEELDYLIDIPFEFVEFD